MNNNKIFKSIIWAGFFAVCFGIGFIGVRAIKKSQQKKQLSITEIPADNWESSTPKDSVKLDQSQNYSGTNEITDKKEGETNQKDISKEDNTQNQKQDVQESKVTISASKPKLNGEYYSFVVTANNLPQNESYSYELYTIKGAKVQSSSNGVFSSVPGVAGGKYVVWLVGSKSGRLTSTTVRGCNLPKKENDNKVTSDSIKQNNAKSEKSKKMLITKEEFQRRLLNPNDLTLKRAKKVSDRQSLLSNKFNLVVIETKSDEAKIPTDLEGVREKIHFDAWKSATVVDISYDEATGQVTSVVVKPVY